MIVMLGKYPFESAGHPTFGGGGLNVILNNTVNQKVAESSAKLKVALSFLHSVIVTERNKGMREVRNFAYKQYRVQIWRGINHRDKESLRASSPW